MQRHRVTAFSTSAPHVPHFKKIWNGAYDAIKLFFPRLQPMSLAMVSPVLDFKELILSDANISPLSQPLSYSNRDLRTAVL